jgi:hypothetical protein
MCQVDPSELIGTGRTFKFFLSVKKEFYVAANTA